MPEILKEGPAAIQVTPAQIMYLEAPNSLTSKAQGGTGTFRRKYKIFCSIVSLVLYPIVFRIKDFPHIWDVLLFHYRVKNQILISREF